LRLNKFFSQWLKVEFYKIGKVPPNVILSTKQLAADLYLLVTSKDSSLADKIQEQLGEILENILSIELKQAVIKFKQISATEDLSCKVAIIIKDSRCSNTTGDTVSWEDILSFGKKQHAFLIEVKNIITQHNLINIENIQELQNIPTLPFIQELSPTQKLGFIKLGIKYFSIMGGTACNIHQDSAFSLLTEIEQKFIFQSRYWNLHIISSRDDNEVFLQITESIIKAIEYKQVIFDLNCADWNGKTCLDHVISKTKTFSDEKTRNAFKKNGKLCALLLLHGAKATSNINEFSRRRKIMYSDQDQIRMTDNMVRVVI